MNANEIHSRLREEYSNLIESHDELKELRQSDSSFKTDDQLACEMDGVLEGIRAIEDILNEIEGEDDTTSLADHAESFADSHDLSDDEYTRVIDAVDVIRDYEDNQ